MIKYGIQLLKFMMDNPDKIAISSQISTERDLKKLSCFLKLILQDEYPVYEYKWITMCVLIIIYPVLKTGT